LFLEHEASSEGQEILDRYEPLKASVDSPNSVASKLLKGKKLCVNRFDTFQNTAKWTDMAVEAFGFPKEEKRQK
jgi:hypothetical protein